jgi:hypothetical protein
MAIKRKNEFVNPESSGNTGKKVKLTEGAIESAIEAAPVLSSSTKGNEQAPVSASNTSSRVQEPDSGLVLPEDKEGADALKDPKPRPNKRKIRKLAPARPFPLVPTSVSATGPRSAHKEGKNFICITRRTGLGAYLRRCKDVVLKDGSVRSELS